MPVLPPMSDLVFDDHRQGADRLDHAANLRGRADVHARADLGARPDQRVRVDQRVGADPRADVHVHRRHADDAGRQVGAVADRRAAGHDADARLDPGPLQRQRVLVVERQAAMVHRRVDEIAEAEAEENPLLDPRVHAPADRTGWIRLGGANGPSRQRGTQLRKHRASRFAIRGRRGGDEILDVGFKHQRQMKFEDLRI